MTPANIEIPAAKLASKQATQTNQTNETMLSN